MSTTHNVSQTISKLFAGAVIAGTIALTASAAAAAGQTPVGISEPGHFPPAMALVRPSAEAPQSSEVTPERNSETESRPKAAWEDCEPGSYWMMEGPDSSVPLLCR